MLQWMIAIGGLLLFAGITFFSGVWKDPYMLDGKGAKVARVAGIVSGTLLLFWSLGAFFEPPPSGESAELAWLDESQVAEAQARSRSEGRPLMIDFWSKTCTNCKVLEREVLKAPEVASALGRDFVLLKVNTDILYENNKPTYQALKERFGNIDSQPYIVFVSPGDVHLKAASFHGLVDVPAFQEKMASALEGEAGAGGEDIGAMLAKDGLAWVLVVVFLGGVGASLTPCVYPLIPITLSLFGARESDSRLQAFFLSSVYVAGIVVTYTVLGLVAASVGRGIGEAMSHPGVVIGMAAVMAVMAAGSLGLFEMNLPTSVQTKLSSAGGKGVAGAFVMGLLAGLIATPCVGPILVAVLVYVAQSQDLVLGGTLLAVFALGMGMLFLVLGTFASAINKIPRSGAWMVGVKTFFGIVFLVAALYYLRIVVPQITAPLHWLYSIAGA